MLRNALNRGYREGYRAGEADRYDRWNYGYDSSYAYRDASYGYDSYYVGLSEYQYYFRQGFRRGYDDGYYRNSNYGRNNSLFGSIFRGILSLARF